MEPQGKDLYEVLGVSRAASPAQIRAEYIRRVELYDPGRLTAPSEQQLAAGAEMMAALDEAWRVLGNPELRAAYDARRSPPRTSTRAPDPSRAPRPTAFPRSAWPRLAVGLLLVVLPVGAVIATASNWFSPFTGRLYSSDEIRYEERSSRQEGYDEGYDRGFEDGTDEGYDRGYEEGTAEGYDEGYGKGYTEGTDEGFEAGCLAVFDAVGSSVVYNSYSSLGASACDG